MNTVRVPTTMDCPIIDAAFLANPYPTYQALRQAGPIHWSEEFFGGAWLVTRHADVELVLRDPRFSAQRTGAWVKDHEETRGELSGFQRLFARALLFLDAPDHPRVRKVLNTGFRPDVIHQLVPHIERIITGLLDQVEDLLSNPDQWQRLQQDPALLPGAVRELMRFDSPVQYTGRRVATDLVLHGQQLRRGDLVLPFIGAANRDPARYFQPDKLDIARKDGASLAFGSGPHVCIGAALTRLEAEMVFREVLRRWPEISLAEAAPLWGQNPAYRGLVTLPLRRRVAQTPGFS